MDIVFILFADYRLRGELITIIRGLGMLLGLVILGIAVASIVDGLPTAAIGSWIMGELFLLLLGVLLLAPWRYIVLWRLWWLPFALLALSLIGSLVLLAPDIVWASYHGAVGGIEILLGAIVIIIGLAQLVAIWHLRRQVP